MQNRQHQLLKGNMSLKQYIYGVDLGGTSIKFGLFEEDGFLLEQWSRPTQTKEQGKQILPDIAEEIAACGKRRALLPEQIKSIGLGVPGEVGVDGFIQPCANLNGWGGFDAGKELQKLCGYPTQVINDANAAALGEMHWGSGAKNMVFVTLGTGIGGGVVMNGKLWCGAHGSAGEFGHMKICFGENTFWDDWEHYASASALARTAQGELVNPKETLSALSTEEKMTARYVVDSAKAGNKQALSLVQRLCEDLGRGLSVITSVVDPERIVLGGGLAAAGDFLLYPVREAYRRYAFSQTRETPFYLAKLGADAGIYGAAFCCFAKEN